MAAIHENPTETWLRVPAEDRYRCWECDTLGATWVRPDYLGDDWSGLAWCSDCLPDFGLALDNNGSDAS